MKEDLCRAEPCPVSQSLRKYRSAARLPPPLGAVTKMTKFHILPFLLLSLGACAEAESDPVQAEASVDICEQAALHRQECVGDYVTPPECDASAEFAAQELLNTPCEDFSGLSANGKSDGALCDWFGTGCTPDEPIFAGPACATDADCETGFCAEKHCFQGVASDEFAQMLDLRTQTDEQVGSTTQLLIHNAETRQLRHDLASQATTSLHFSAFIIQDDDSGHEMVADFVAAAQRGVRVRVIVDATTQNTFADYKMLVTLAEGGVEVLAFNPVTEWFGLRTSIDMSANDRLHEKILVVDGREAVMGGRNVGNEYLVDGQWRDTDVYVAGKGVEGIQRLLLKDWDRIASFEVAGGCESQADWGFACPTEPVAEDPLYFPELEELGPSKTRAIFSDPFYQETPLGYFTTLALVRSAKKSITIANSYFVPPRRLRVHLKAAVQRGVEVKVLTNSLESTDAWWMYYASINYYKELIGAGIQIYQYNGTETMHSKTMLIDNEMAVVGSFNLDPRSAVDNSESMLLIRDGEVVQHLKNAFVTDFAFSKPATANLSIAELAKAKTLRLAEPLL